MKKTALFDEADAKGPLESASVLLSVSSIKRFVNFLQPVFFIEILVATVYPMSKQADKGLQMYFTNWRTPFQAGNASTSRLRY